MSKKTIGAIEQMVDNAVDSMQKCSPYAPEAIYDAFVLMKDVPEKTRNRFERRLGKAAKGFTEGCRRHF